MAVFEIPIPVSTGIAFKFRADLEGVLFLFEFRYNTRGQYWMLGLSDAGGEPIVNGVRCVIDYSLLAHCSSEIQPLGQLRLVDTSQTSTDPGPYDLGDRVRLTYVPSP